MNRSQIEAKLTALVAEVLEVDQSEIDLTKPLAEYGQLDSLALIELVESIESEFVVRIADDKLVEFDTLSDVVSEIENLLNSGNDI